MAVNETMEPTGFTAPGTRPASASVSELRDALARLDSARANVNNCDCDPSNCCQSTLCQTCQEEVCQACQSWRCQSQCGSNCTNCNCNCDSDSSG